MMDIKKLRARVGMSQRQFAEYFNIPKRTIENWEGGQRKPPPYVIELIKYKIEKERLGMLKLIEKDNGEEKILKEGVLEEIIEYLKENKEIYTWILDEDKGIELPNLDEIKTLRDLEIELKKIDLDWWTLEVKEM